MYITILNLHSLRLLVSELLIDRSDSLVELTSRYLSDYVNVSTYMYIFIFFGLLSLTCSMFS